MEWWLLLSLALLGFFFAGCPCCESCAGTVACTPCSDSPTSRAKKLVLAGITNNGCSDCDDLNGTYFLCETQQNPSSCDWEFSLPATICIFTILRLVIISSFPAGFFVGLHGGAHHADWRKSYSTGQNPDCDEIDMDIPYAGAFTTAGAAAECVFSSSTCTYSNVP